MKLKGQCLDAPFTAFPLSVQMKGLDVDALHITHIQVNRAPKQRRRTYRAHGRINREWSIANVACAFVLLLCRHGLSPLCTARDQFLLSFTLTL